MFSLLSPSPPLSKAIGADLSPNTPPTLQSAPTFSESLSDLADSNPPGVSSRCPAPTFELRPVAALHMRMCFGTGKEGMQDSQVELAGEPAHWFIVTAYCPCEKCCGKFADGITASGHIIQEGDCFVAAPPWIPFGTRLSIPGYVGGLMVAVEDRGGAIVGNRLDVFFSDHNEALAWGIKTFRVEQ